MFGQSVQFSCDRPHFGEARLFDWFRVRLMPGDTIVGRKKDSGVVLKGFKDWTQISTFVIGAATAKVLFP
jgi:hypothetical protein